MSSAALSGPLLHFSSIVYTKYQTICFVILHLSAQTSIIKSASIVYKHDINFLLAVKIVWLTIELSRREGRKRKQ